MFGFLHLRRAITIAVTVLFTLCSRLPHVVAIENCTNARDRIQAQTLPVTAYLELLQTELEDDLEVFSSTLFPNATSEELLERAQIMWEYANSHEYERACKGEIEDVEKYPYAICNTEPGVSGNQRKFGGVGEMANITSIKSQIPDDAHIYSLINTNESTCVFCNLFFSDVIKVSGEYIAVQPVVMGMKLMKDTAKLLQSQLEDFESSHNLTNVTNPDREDTGGGEFERNNTAQFPSVNIMLCPGILSGDGSGDQKAEDVTSNMTEFFLGTTTFVKADGQEVNVSKVTDAAFYSKVNFDAVIANLTAEEAKLGFSPTKKSEFWSAAFERGLETGVCADTIRYRLKWALVRGLDEDDVSHAHVEFNDTGSEPIEGICATALVGALALMPQVCSLEIRRPVETQNDKAQWMTQTGLKDERPWFEAGLDGKGQIVAVSDTGLDSDHCYFWDNDDDVPFGSTPSFSHRKIVQYTPVSDKWYFENDYTYGHGTHVAGTIAGRRSNDGTTENTGMVDGVARSAKLAFFDFGDDEGNLHLPSSDYKILNTGRLGTSTDPKAHVHSASWGSTANYYTLQSKNFDQYMYRNDDFMIIVAGGNSGRGDAAYTIGSPATAKNVLTVGASHSVGDDLKDGQLGPAHMADFSSRGPVEGDNRIKPDIVAPGKYILSAGSLPDQSNECDPGSRPAAGGRSAGVLSIAGTSMATPVVSGTAALIRQYFEEGYYPTGEKNATNARSPSGALVKAVLLNGAQTKDMEENGGVDNGDKGVTRVKAYDNTIGFGRISLIDSLYLVGKTNIQATVWDGERVFDQETKTYMVTIDKSRGCESTVFSTTLVWLEPAATPGCTKCVLNDLDLTVIRDNGKTLYPNGLNTNDRTNNVERVRIYDASDGETFEIRVVGNNLDNPSQKFALVATGCFGGVANTLDTSQNVFETDTSEDGSSNKLETWQIIAIVAGSLVGVCLLCCCCRFMQKRK